MVHIDPATLRRHPIIGVLIGGGAALVIGWLLISGTGEARALLAQKTPDALSLREIVSQQGVRWVTLTEGEWHCDRAITIERSAGPERWIMGPVEATEVPITGSSDGDVLVAIFDGEVKCAQRAGSALTGVVGSTQIFTTDSARRRWRHSGDRVAILSVGASPRYALMMLIGLGAIAALGVGFAGYYLAVMLRSVDRHSAPLPSEAPIEAR